MTADPVRTALEELVAARDWQQFHTTENLIKSISVEAAELLECVQWDADTDPTRLKEELADVLTYCHLLAAKLELDPDEIILEKLEQTKAKYPVDKARGSSTKYDQLPD
jgi:NTP pyrophosphatase (non-canonical NTP hydrolase)